jgi:outer membrane protein assembly factor BamD
MYLCLIMKNFNLLCVLAGLALIVSVGCSRFNKLQKHGTLEEKLKAAIEYYDDKEYYKANTLLEEILPLVRGRIEAERATFYLAYTHYKQKEYVMSSYYFREFALTYPRSEYTEEAVFMHGKSQYMDSPEYNLDQTSTEGAIKYLQEYANKYPTGKYMEETNKLLDELSSKVRFKTYENCKLYAKIRNYKSAVVAIQGFLDAYPDTEYSEEMYYLRFESQYYLAKNSIESKQLDRYYEAIEFYHNFVDKYPGSKYVKQAEAFYETSRSKIKVLTSL